MLGLAVVPGFAEDGNPGCTCAEFALMGSFCDVTAAPGTQRDGKYAVSLSAADMVSTPEPAAFSMLCVAGCLPPGASFWPRRSSTESLSRRLP